MKIRKRVLGLGLALIAVFSGPASALAHAPSGAIFTTLSDGTEVNLNQFPSKEAVYLDGGPGPGAPQSAAGLDNGTYVFMVTDPSGKVLLSTDPAQCRRFTVNGGIINGVVTTGGCEHQTGLDVDHGATTVQLFPFDDTPNPGGVYKVWVTRDVDFPAACLTTVDCTVAGTKHGFKPAHSKTDNFKVDPGDSVRQIDVRFFRDKNDNGHFDAGEEILPHMKMGWTDTPGVNNVRYSDPEFQWGTLAHIEVPETDNGGTHYLTFADQKGCKIGQVHVNDLDVQLDAKKGLAVNVAGNYDYFVDVACTRGN